MTHLGAHAFDEIQGEVVQTVSFVLNNNYIGGYKGSYVRLLDEKNENAKRLAFLQKKKVSYSNKICLPKFHGTNMFIGQVRL